MASGFCLLAKTVLPDERPARAAGVRTPFYCFAWLFRWSRMGFLADQRKARTIS